MYSQHDIAEPGRRTRTTKAIEYKTLLAASLELHSLAAR
jgi:hypothetical protein